MFASPEGKQFDRYAFTGRYFREAATRAGLESVTFHELRHGYVSLMAGAGVHVSVIAASVGHKDGGALLLRRYTHLFGGVTRSAADALNAHIAADSPRAGVAVLSAYPLNS